MKWNFLVLLIVMPMTVNAEKSVEQKKTVESDAAPEDYSTRRFNEIIDAYLKSETKNLQEQLISYRAKLVIAERRWNELKDVKTSAGEPETDKRDGSHANLLKAAQAEMNHYQSKIARLEEQVLREKRKARDEAVKVSKKKKR